MSLHDKEILVTGATGFIGSRLAQRLALEEAAVVTGSGRRLEAVPFLRESGVTLARADLLDFPRMDELLAEKEIVFHVAAWLSNRHGGPEMAWPVNVFATLNLVRQAAAAGVERFVYISSVAAYGPPDASVMDEGRPVDLAQASRYGRTKAEAEQRALALARQVSLALTVVRPGMVYGPRSRGWSVRMLRLVQRGVPVLFGNGHGYAYPIYIDNLVDLLLCAASQSAAAGEAFNAVDGPVTWREWFGAYGRMAGREPNSLPLWLARLLLRAAEWLPLGLSINQNLLTYYTGRTRFPMTKAEQLLGYEQRVSFEDGMRRTQEWLAGEGYL